MFFCIATPSVSVRVFQRDIDVSDDIHREPCEQGFIRGMSHVVMGRLRSPVSGRLHTGGPGKPAAWLSPSPKASEPGEPMV